MTQIFAADIQPDTVLLIDGAPYFVEGTREVNQYDETVAYTLRALSPEGFLSESPLLRRFGFEDLVTLKG